MENIEDRGTGKAATQGEVGVDNTSRPSAAEKAEAAGAETAAAADAASEKDNKQVATN